MFINVNGKVYQFIKWANRKGKISQGDITFGSLKDYNQHGALCRDVQNYELTVIPFGKKEDIKKVKM